MRHLVFPPIHVHSFIFIVLALLIGMYMTIDAKLGGITTVMVFATPVYLIIAMKKFYGQKCRKSHFEISGNFILVQYYISCCCNAGYTKCNKYFVEKLKKLQHFGKAFSLTVRK